MMVELSTMKDYISILESNKIQILKAENISQNVARTWDITLNIIKSRAFWELAIRHGKQFTSFLHSFQAMKKGFSSANFVYGLILGKKL